MSDQAVGVAERARIAEVAERDRRAASRNTKRLQRGVEGPRLTEEILAHEEALQMDLAIEQAKAQGVSPKDAVRRVSQRPEFRPTSEVRVALDDIADAISENRFGDTRKILSDESRWQGLDIDGLTRRDLYMQAMVTEHARALIDKGDSKHFVATVSFLGNYLDAEDMPEHVGPEIKEAVGERFLASFQDRNLNDFAELVMQCQRLGIDYQQEGSIQESLHQEALTWLEEKFGELEGGDENADPRDSLLLLSSFMDAYEDWGVALDSGDVKKRKGLFQQVKNALAAAKKYKDPDDSVDEATDNDVDAVQKEFDPGIVDRLKKIFQ